MPYPGVPKSKTKKVEKCVASLMNDPKFKPKKKGQTKKQAAIAVCVSSIKGNSKLKDYNEDIFIKFVAEPEANDFINRTNV